MKTPTCVQLWGYTIYKDGTIIGRVGNKLRDTELINIKWEDKHFKNVSKARFVYWSFNQDFDFNDKELQVAVKNPNKGCRLDNLELVKKIEIVRGRKKLTDEQVEEIKRQHKEENRNFNDLAKKFKVSNTMIAYIIKGRKLNY